MREYLLYVKETGNRARAYVTPCFLVDRQFWEQADGHRLYIVGSSPSLALAFGIREEINRFLERARWSAKLLEQLQQQAVAYTAKAHRLYIRERGEEAANGFDFRVHQADASSEDVWMGGEAAGAGWTDPAQPSDPVDPSDPDTTLTDVLSGRALLWSEAEPVALTHGIAPEMLEAGVQRLCLAEKAEWLPGVRLAVDEHWWRDRLSFACVRCGSCDVFLTDCAGCRQGCAYCRTCLQLGRSRCCTPVILVPAPLEERDDDRTAHHLAAGQPVLRWHGHLSPWQRAAAAAARRFVSDPHAILAKTAMKVASLAAPADIGSAAETSPPADNGSPVETSSPADNGHLPAFLIWAVCGAGKTELIFPAVAHAVSAGQRVLIATPRKDVVDELVPRIRQAFSGIRVLSIHGSSTEKWDDGQIVVATTHQVLRFYRRFPLVIVDEVDAFPFHNNAMLHRAVERAVTLPGKRLYLSATPPVHLRRRLVTNTGTFLTGRKPAHASPTHVLLPRRYHGHPLPVPHSVTIPGLTRKLAAGKLIPPLLDAITRSFDQNRRVFLFVPRIEDVNRVLQYLIHLRQKWAGRIDGVHAADPEREPKVRAFREETLRLLVTTTILERGVTVPRSDVIVLGADAPLFDESSLVQIAGRVGRSADSPDGHVLFFVNKRNAAVLGAIRQIRQMNRLAQEWGEEGSHA